MAGFRAFRIVNEHDTVRGALVDLTLDDLSPGEVVIRAVYSSVNYKDALAGTGTGKILRTAATADKPPQRSPTAKSSTPAPTTGSSPGTRCW